MTSNRDWLMRLAHEAPDELAAWMDAEHETNGNVDATNGIHASAPLAEGDAVAILRDWLDYKINRFDAEANAIILNTGADPDKLYEIADMVERDYVRRDDYDFTVEMLNCMKVERDEWKAKAEGFTEALEKLGCSVLANGTVFGPTEAKSAKRAAAERLRRLGDLLTDDAADEPNGDSAAPKSWEAAEDAATKGYICNFDDSREKLEADVDSMVRVHELYWLRTYIIEWLDRQAAITEHEARAQLDADWPKLLRCLENDYGIAASWDGLRRIWLTERAGGSATDAVREFAARYERRIAELEDELHRSYDAQAAKAEELTQRNVRIAELEAERKKWHEKYEKSIELEAELIQVRGDLKNATHNYAIAKAKCESREQAALRRERRADEKMAEAERAIAEPPDERTRELIAKLERERDGWRMRCGALLDAAHAMQGVADAWDEEV